MTIKIKSFDSVVVLEVLEHLFGDNQAKGLFETVRVLKKDGSLFISVPYKESMNYISCAHCKSLTLVDSYHSVAHRINIISGFEVVL